MDIETAAQRPSAQDRVVAVTGAGTGIGRATARAFAAEGAHVLAIGRRLGPLEETAGDSDRITPLPADITAEGAPEEIARVARDRHGRLDVLVNNAGIVRSGALGSFTRDDLAPMIDTNLVAPLLLTQALLPLLEESGGVVVNVSTAVGQRGWPGNSAYAGTKGALDVFTRSWAVELAPRGVRVAAVAPGAIATSIGDHQGLSPEEQADVRKWQVSITPLGRIGTPEEVAWAITRLADPASSFVTGAVLPVDGGAMVG
ncbi:SDR family oxidoreductase [Streptomonospora sp. S1-112]|uniref:SDR family oxidoreductase n=1 Tax=Streptomonospora mangrovi TaxID=2883123 RepID=A0A9X3NRI8_9ACTN|nr:SDR family oxidoreductase [Streptomonospora mangrovi]MDA0562791.1 SDR family oxidoreductase [Streptomonospora mangrovi]